MMDDTYISMYMSIGNRVERCNVLKLIASKGQPVEIW